MSVVRGLKGFGLAMSVSFVADADSGTFSSALVRPLLSQIPGQPLSGGVIW